MSVYANYFNSRLAVLLLLIALGMTPCFADGPDAGPDFPPLETEPNPEALMENNQSRVVFVPGDAVFISAFPDTGIFLNGVFPIDDRGYVELPIYGKAKISHMSREQFVNFLRENFRDYLRYPHLYIKPLIRVSVLGGVPAPGFYYFDPDRSFWELMYEVRGTTDEDGLKEIRWKRSGKVVQGDMIPDLQSGISLRKMGFRSGDQIWVKTPGKPGFVERFSRYFTFVTAGATVFTLYLTYLRFLEGR